jgi:hypothetical protein
MEIIRPLIISLCLLVIGLHSSFAAAGQGSTSISVLWVIDDLYLQESSNISAIQDSIVSLANSLDTVSIKYRMAVTTSDTFTNNGKLLPNADGLSIVSSTTPDHINTFRQILSSISPNVTSFWRQGLEASLIVVNQSQGLLQPNSPLEIIYLTGEDDYSCASNCYGVEPWHNKNWIRKDPLTYVKAFQTVESGQGIRITLYPIIGLPNCDCTIAHVGQNYQLAQSLMGTGLTTSVCVNELRNSINRVATDIIRSTAN